MGWLMAKLYDRMMRRSEAACLAAWRSELLAGLRGDVLELGSGTGANLPFFPASVDRLVLTEPDRHMRAKLAATTRALGRQDVEVVDATADSLPVAPASFDAVVSTLVLCSVPDPASTLGEVTRVLRPGGTLLFLEHVAAEDDPRLGRWQRFVEPLWKRFAGNCHVTRRTAALLVDAGFELSRLDRRSMLGAPSFVRPTIVGEARLG